LGLGRGGLTQGLGVAHIWRGAPEVRGEASRGRQKGTDSRI